MDNTDIQHIRLINGEELISVVRDITEKFIICENPLVVEEMGDDEQGSRKVLCNYIKFSSGIPVCSLQKEHVIIMNPVHPEVRRYYINSLQLTYDADKVFIEAIKRANQKMEEYSRSTSLLEEIEMINFEEKELELLDSPYYHMVSNTSH